MKSVGFDTCVVLRLLVGEPEEQAKQAYTYLEKCYLTDIKIYISDLVIVEVYHALRHHYQVPEQETVSNLTDFLSSPMLTPSGHALTTLQEYKGKGAGFVDRLIRMDLLDHAQQIVTFDKKFAQLSNVSKI